MRAALISNVTVIAIAMATSVGVGACAHDEHAGGYLVPVAGGAAMPVTLVPGGSTPQSPAA